MLQSCRRGFYLLATLLIPVTTHAASWTDAPPQTDTYAVLKSDNEPGIAIASNLFYGLSTAPRYTSRFNPANLQLASHERTSVINLPAGTYYADGLIREGAPMAQPLLRFSRRNTTPSSYVNRLGFRKQLWQQDDTSDAFAAVQFGLEYFPIFARNSSTSFTIRSCWTTTDYDDKNTQCLDTARPYQYQKLHHYLKSYDFVFNQQSATATIMIDSDGTHNIIGNTSGCRAAHVNSSDGVICHLFKFLPTQYIDDAATRNTVGYGLFRNDSRLASLTANDVLVSANNGTTWTGLESSVYIRNYPIRNDDVYVFFSNSFFSKISALDLNAFDINNAFYLGLSRNIGDTAHLDITLPISSNIKIVPRTVYASITSHSSGYLDGKVGKDVITFPYTIQETGPTSAVQLLISVAQASGTTFNNRCTFYPSDTSDTRRGVPIDTYLSFNTVESNTVTKEILCDSRPIDLRQLGIKDSRPPVYGTDGFNIPSISRFYDFDLIFNLKDSGNLTTTGENWEGAVYQTGSITFRAIWD